VTRFFSVVIALAFLHPLCGAQGKPVRDQATPPCTVTEGSIFKEARICGKSRVGSMSKPDLIVAGFSIGESNSRTGCKTFPRQSSVQAHEGNGSLYGHLRETKAGNAVVFSSGDLAAPRGLDSIFIARAETFERQGADCLEIASLPGGPSTNSGIQLGMEKARLLALLRIPQAKGGSFAVDYATSPDKAPWVSEKSKPSGKGWVAISGA